MTTRIKLRRDTAANWLASNPILAAGEPGLEIDSGQVKYGDGTSTWTELSYSSGGSSRTDTGNVVITAGSTEHWVATQRREDYDTRPRGLRYDSEGNLYSLTKTSFQQSTISVITKYTAAGAIAWQKSFTGAWPVALAVDSNDCAYITVEPDSPGVTVIKFGTAGEILWKKEYDVDLPSYNAFIEEKSATTMALAFSAATDGFEGSNIVVVMEISSTDGSVQIKKQIAFADADQAVSPTGIDVDSDENVFVTGFYFDTNDSKNKMFIEKLDEDLDRVWTKSLESPDNYDMYGGDCASDAQGNIYAVGAYEVSTPNQGGPTNSTAGILTKLNSSGVVQWTRRIGPGTCGSFIVGLTATDTGDVYLSAVTFANNTDIGLIGGESGLEEFYSVNKMLVARLDTQGAAVWQRYVDVRNLFEEWDSEDSRGQAVAVFGDKFAVDGYGESWNTTPYYGGESADEEDDYFVVQLPTDGTALTIGNLDFTESRMPARFVTHTTSDSPLAITEYAETVLVENSELAADTETRVANNIVNSDTYDYVFGADGTLTIPNDGDVKLTQSQVGYMVAIGGGENNNDNINSRAVAVDSQGNMYVGGEDGDDSEPFITKISPDGVKVWGVLINEDTEGHPGRVNGLTIHPDTGAVVAVCEMYGGYTYSTVITLDQDTGHISSNVKYSDDSADVYLNDIAYTSTGNVVLAGSKYGEFTANANVTPQAGSTTGNLIILRSDLANVVPSSWQIGGTGIDPFENIAYVERYTGLTGTTREGTDATFDIINNGNGTYSASVVNGGSNYLVGHKIKILGTDLGGATPDNDCVLTVATVDAGAITLVTNTGTAAAVGGASEITFTGESSVTFSASTNTFDFGSPRTLSLSSVWSSFAAGATITATIDGMTGYTFTLANPPVSGGIPVTTYTQGTSYSTGGLRINGGDRSSIEIIADSSFWSNQADYDDLVAKDAGTEFSVLVDGVPTTVTTNDVWSVYGPGIKSVFCAETGTIYGNQNVSSISSSGDPMLPDPYTINVTGENGVLSGTVTEFTISTTSDLTEIASTTSLVVDSMTPGGPFLSISKPISNATFAAAIAEIPSGATIKAWNEMFALSEFTLTSPFTDNGTSWIATFTQNSGSGTNFGSLTVSSPAGSGSESYNELPGTNYEVGSGFTLTYEGPRNNTDYDSRWDYNVTNGGSNYVENDVIVIAGTSLGGASTTNDMAVRVYASGGTVQYINQFTGTAQSTTWKLETTTQVDFGGTGAWAIVRPLDRENLLITPGWTRTFGTDGNEEDRLYSVAVDSSDNIIAVGQGHGDVNGDEEDLAMVYKFNSTGTLQWARKLNEISYDCYAKSVTTIGTDIYVTHESSDDGETVVTKLDASGDIKWQRITNSGDDSVITRTQDGNLLVGVEGYDEDVEEDALKVFLMTPSGEVIYKRWLLATTDNDTAFKNGRCLAVDSDSFYITAYFDANDYNSSIAARLPIDGSGTGEYGSFSYKDVNPMGGEQYGPFGDSGLDTDTNYEINTINIEEDSYAGALTVGEEVYVKSTATVTTGTGEFYVDSYYPTLTVEIVRDTDGGSIVFADGSKQSTSATDIPQRIYTGQKYTLGLEDRGHHILCTASNDSILVPYDARVEFPIGTVITIVNTNSSSVYIYKEGGSIDMMIVGTGFYNSIELTQYGMATLLKVGRENWVIAGNVQPN